MDVAGKAGGLINVRGDSSTLDDRELGRGETCCPGDIWDLTGGDITDVARKAGGLVKVPGDSATLEDWGLSRGEPCCLGAMEGCG